MESRAGEGHKGVSEDRSEHNRRGVVGAIDNGNKVWSRHGRIPTESLMVDRRPTAALFTDSTADAFRPMARRPARNRQAVPRVIDSFSVTSEQFQ